MVNDKIFVSVLMSVYSEKPSILEECINSILKQTFSNFEFLIYLDKPDNEELWSFLVEKASQDSRIIIHKNEKNRLLAGTLNDELAIAKGEYIVRMDGDDVSVPNRIEALVDYMEVHQDVGVASSWMKEFGHRSIIDNRIVKYEESFERMKVIYLCQSPIAHAPCIIRRCVVNDFGPALYNERCSKSQDYELWSRLIQKGVIFGMVNKALYLRRSAQFAGANPIKYQVIINQICRKNIRDILSSVKIELKNTIKKDLIVEVHTAISNNKGVLKKQLEMIQCIVYSNVYNNIIERLIKMVINGDFGCLNILTYLPFRYRIHYFKSQKFIELNNIVSSSSELIYTADCTTNATL